MEELIREIVRKACALKNKYTSEVDAPVNYACVFCQSEEEFSTFKKLVRGSVIKETPSGPLFKIDPIKTVSGELKLLKIRNPDVTRTERGDADFTVKDYPAFKQKHPDFKVIDKGEFEMLELMESGADVRVYFSHPTVGEVLGV